MQWLLHNNLGLQHIWIWRSIDDRLILAIHRSNYLRMIPRSTYPIEIYQLNDNQHLNQQSLPSHLIAQSALLTRHEAKL